MTYKCTLWQEMLDLSQFLDQLLHALVVQTLWPCAVIHTSCSWPSPLGVDGGKNMKQSLGHREPNPISLELDPSCTYKIKYKFGVLSVLNGLSRINFIILTTFPATEHLTQSEKDLSGPSLLFSLPVLLCDETTYCTWNKVYRVNSLSFILLFSRIN